jgi:hypothetical protein
MSETKTTSVMTLRAPALIFVLYVAVMQRTNDTAFMPIALGTTLWMLTGLILAIVVRPDPIWLWVCAVGAVAGLIGLLYLNRRAKRPGISYE